MAPSILHNLLLENYQCIFLCISTARSKTFCKAIANVIILHSFNHYKNIYSWSYSPPFHKHHHRRTFRACTCSLPSVHSEYLENQYKILSYYVFWIPGKLLFYDSVTTRFSKLGGSTFQTEKEPSVFEERWSHMIMERLSLQMHEITRFSMLIAH